jgi:ribosomal protein S18 acetylase RimI-like enzyme
LTDVAALAEVARLQDLALWGSAEAAGEDDIRELLARARELRVVRCDGEVAAYAIAGGDGGAELVVRPGCCADALDEVVAWLSAQGVERVEAPAADARRLAALLRGGFAPGVRIVDLERSAAEPLADPSWPPGVRAGTLDPASRNPLAQPPAGHAAFAPEHQVAAWRGAELAGVAICRTYGPTHGWVSELAVAEGARGLGLGLALLLEAFARLAASGVDVVGISVPVGGERELARYRALGLTAQREVIVCTKQP